MKKLAKKPRIGRPPLADRRQLRDKRLDFVRFSAAEIESLKQQAEREEVAVSQWVRQRLGLA